MSIRVITHCYAEKLPFFAHLLKYHLHSAYHSICDFDLVFEIVCTHSDKNTLEILGAYSKILRNRLNVQIVDKIQLGTRAYGRNRAALQSKEDLLWFCDVDYTFSPNTMNQLFELTRSKPEVSMFYPKVVNVSKDHATGDATIEAAARHLPLLTIESDYMPSEYSRAIGGAQIVNGDVARKIGYLNGTKWVKPRDIPLASFADDVVARKAYRKCGETLPLDLNGVYRIRHSTSSYR